MVSELRRRNAIRFGLSIGLYCLDKKTGFLSLSVVSRKLVIWFTKLKCCNWRINVNSYKSKCCREISIAAYTCWMRFAMRPQMAENAMLSWGSMAFLHTQAQYNSKTAVPIHFLFRTLAKRDWSYMLRIPSIRVKHWSWSILASARSVLLSVCVRRRSTYRCKFPQMQPVVPDCSAKHSVPPTLLPN